MTEEVKPKASLTGPGKQSAAVPEEVKPKTSTASGKKSTTGPKQSNPAPAPTEQVRASASAPQGKSKGSVTAEPLKKSDLGPKVPPEPEPPKQLEICDLPQNVQCELDCHCRFSRYCQDLENERKRRNDEPRPSIENRNGFYKALEECCYDCRYCPYVIYNRWADNRPKYARNQYPLTTTQKSDYRPFKATDPENDIRIMGMIRGWGLGPDFLHHPHLDSVSSPEELTLYRHTYNNSDCCRKKSIMPYYDYPNSNCCARINMCNTENECNYMRVIPREYRRKFTQLGNEPIPYSTNDSRVSAYSYKHDDYPKINELYYKPQRFVGHPRYHEPPNHFDCLR